MKTTIDIPENVLSEAIRHTGAKTKREAVVAAVEDFNRRHRLATLAKRLYGSMPNLMTREDLQAMREDRQGETAR